MTPAERALYLLFGITLGASIVFAWGGELAAAAGMLTGWCASAIALYALRGHA